MCAQELGVLALQYSGNVAECGPACRQADQEGALELPLNQNMFQLLNQALHLCVRSFQVFRSADTKRWRRVPDRFDNGRIYNINSWSQYGKC